MSVVKIAPASYPKCFRPTTASPGTFPLGRVLQARLRPRRGRVQGSSQTELKGNAAMILSSFASYHLWNQGALGRSMLFVLETTGYQPSAIVALPGFTRIVFTLFVQPVQAPKSLQIPGCTG